MDVDGLDGLDGLGLGLEYSVVRLGPVDPRWVVAGAQLADGLNATLGELAVAVEHIGSTAVPEVLAKPILDFAVGVTAGADVARITKILLQSGWLYRGDAGDDGGLVFVFEVAPRVRVAHLHVVEHDGLQWQRYLALRDLLRANPTSRARYEAAKVELASRFVGDDARSLYTSGKGSVIHDLLDSDG